jgi:hypothetical protein
MSWGVRFERTEQVKVFISKLAAEVARRAAREHLQGTNIVFKVGAQGVLFYVLLIQHSCTSENLMQ